MRKITVRKNFTKHRCKYNFPYKFLKMQSIAAGTFRKTGSNICSTPRRGSITVEASIIVPAVILSILAVMIMSLILYQRALLQSVADRAACTGAVAWESLSADTVTGKTPMEGLNDNGLYWRLFEADSGEKAARLEKYARELLEGKNILKPYSNEISVDITNYIVYKRLEITVKSFYKLPGGPVLRLFGSDDMLQLSVTSFAVMDDPAELIRNTDFILDIEKELEDRYPELKSLGEKTREMFAKISDSMEKFLD